MIIINGTKKISIVKIPSPLYLSAFSGLSEAPDDILRSSAYDNLVIRVVVFLFLFIFYFFWTKKETDGLSRATIRTTRQLPNLARLKRINTRTNTIEYQTPLHRRLTKDNRKELKMPVLSTAPKIGVWPPPAKHPTITSYFSYFHFFPFLLTFLLLNLKSGER